jgi:hypothetical protein
MHSLREIQAGFAAALFNPAASREAPGIRADGISPAVRLGFYRTNVFENYRKALASTYPAVEKLIGQGFFEALAREYTRRFSSRSGDVGRHGQYFSEFLSRHPVARQLPYLADVARLEWCIEECFNAAEPVLLPLQRLATVPAEQCGSLRFLLAPSSRLLSSRYPVDQIWRICQSSHASNEQVDLDAGGVNLLVRRDGYAVTTEALSTAQLAMLTALASGYDFSEAFDYACSIEPTFDPGAFLQQHVVNGVLADFTLPAESAGL